MISEIALNKVCRPAILGRGRIIAQRGASIRDRECSYDGGVTRIRGKVASSSGYADHYDATIEFDEAADTVLDFDCTCPAAARYPGPCKHSIALALDFNRDPSGYRGYDRLQHASTSTVLGEYLDRAAVAARPRVGTSTPEPPGGIRLEPTLVHDRDLFLRLRVCGSRGSYVVRSLGDLVADVSSRAFREYGRKLAFVHEPDAFDQRSRELLDFLARCVQNRRSYASERMYGRVYASSGQSSAMPGRELRLSGPEVDDLLQVMLEGELVFESSSQDGGHHAVTVRDGNPNVALNVVEAGDDGFELVRRGKAEFFSGGSRLYAVQSGTLFRCTPALAAQASFLTGVYDSTTPHLTLSQKDAPRFAATLLPQLERAMSVSVPEEVARLRPVPCKLEFYLDFRDVGVTCDVQAVYGERRYHVLARELGQHMEVGRDVAAETDARRLAQRYLTVGEGAIATIPAKADVPIARLMFEGVPEFSRIGSVYTTPEFDRLLNRSKPEVRLKLSVRSNLIDLSVSATDLPLDELYALLSSYRKRRRFHRLRDGSFLDLSTLDLGEAERLAEELGLSSRDLARGHVNVPSYKAFLLDSIMGDDEKDASFRDYVESFRSVDPSHYQLPASLRGSLRPYQVAGFQWLSALCDMGFGGILADEMGLGKSVQLISLLLARRGSGPTLVVCPASLVYNWQAELEKFAPQLDVAVVAGTVPERARVRGESHEVYVTSYDLLRRDVESWARIPLWCEVLDEAQYIKNHETLAARAVKALDAQHRFALTGTPIENRLSELWSIFDFLMPGLLGSYDRFRERYEVPISEGDDEVAERLREAVGPFVLRRLKADVLRDLPDKLEQVVYARMEGEQRSLYLAHEQALRVSLSKGDDDSFGTQKLQVLAELTRLRQICCDPRLLYEDYDGPSCKLQTIMDLVDSVVDAQQKMLVFSQFTSYLDIIAGELDRRDVPYYTITGATPKRRRLELVDAFNADDTPVFLISLKAGGTGLNLVGASVVVHADPWWNAAAQDQATDRAHRIGQTRDVTVYKVIARDTIEDRILALQEAKSDLADQVVGTGGGMSLGSLRKEDLIELLGD